MPSAASLYKSALGRLGLNFPDGLAGSGNAEGVLAAINDALAEFSVEHDWLFLYEESTFTTTAGQAIYSPPENWLRTAWLVMTDIGTELTSRQRREHFSQTAPSRPRWFDTSGDRIVLAPVPDGAYTIRHGYYLAYEPIVRNATAYPDVYDQLEAKNIVVPAMYRPLLVLFIAKNVALLTKDREHHEMILTEIADFTRRVGDNRRRQQAPGRVASRTDY